jgi:hypothetical protein
LELHKSNERRKLQKPFDSRLSVEDAADVWYIGWYRADRVVELRETGGPGGLEDSGRERRAARSRPTNGMLIEECELGVRSYICLKRAGIQTVGDLVSKTEAVLNAIEIQKPQLGGIPPYMIRKLFGRRYFEAVNQRRIARKPPLTCVGHRHPAHRRLPSGRPAARRTRIASRDGPDDPDGDPEPAGRVLAGAPLHPDRGRQ